MTEKSGGMQNKKVVSPYKLYHLEGLRKNIVKITSMRVIPKYNKWFLLPHDIQFQLSYVFIRKVYSLFFTTSASAECRKTVIQQGWWNWICKV
jgi:hypothetical protein